MTKTKECVFLAMIVVFARIKNTFTQKTGFNKIGTVIGIDLGTSFSSVGVFRNGEVEIIVNEMGSSLTPSYVAFTFEGERVVGEPAKNQAALNLENTVFNLKRIIGREWDDPILQSDMKLLPFIIVKKNSKPHVQVSTPQGPKELTPEEISAMILARLKEMAERYLEKKVTHAVITVPAYFNDTQRQATKDAGTIAGLNVIKILNEPTAAAIAYGFDKMKVGKKNLLVFDLGAGTLDVSLIRSDNGNLTVVATNGNTHLGGEDFDQRLVDHFLQMFRKKTGKDASQNKRCVHLLKKELEKGKRALNSVNQIDILIENFFERENISGTLTRATFQELNMELFEEAMNTTQRVLDDAKMKRDDVDEVLLVGGSTRILKIQQVLKGFFKGKESCRRMNLMNPDEAVTRGAAIVAGKLSGEPIKLDIVDVAPRALGIKTSGEIIELFPKHTMLPANLSRFYTTQQDNQDTIQLTVFENDSAKSKYNHVLGKFSITGIPAAPATLHTLEVAFKIDNDGIFRMNVKDTKIGDKDSLKVINTDLNRLTREDVKRMAKDAEESAAATKRKWERAEARDLLEPYSGLLNDLFQAMEALGYKISSKEKITFEDNLAKGIIWLERNFPQVGVSQLLGSTLQFVVVFLRQMQYLLPFLVNFRKYLSLLLPQFTIVVQRLRDTMPVLLTVKFTLIFLMKLIGKLINTLQYSFNLLLDWLTR